MSTFEKITDLNQLQDYYLDIANSIDIFLEYGHVNVAPSDVQKIEDKFKKALGRLKEVVTIFDDLEDDVADSFGY